MLDERLALVYDWSYLTLAELRVMLRDTLRAAVPSDGPFVRALAHEIARREREAADAPRHPPALGE